jgi:flavin-binding protein dodecin
MGVYKVIELVGTSEESWEDAAKQAIDVANKSLRGLRVAEIAKMDVRLDEGKIVEYRVRVNVSFKYED